MSYSSTLLIEELDSTGQKARRSILLQGPGLPFMGAEWKFGNQLVTTWYQGNGDEATQQDLGPRELPSTWQGEWNRTRLNRLPARHVDENGVEDKISAPFILMQRFEAIARSGRRLRVTWAADGTTADKRARIVREGRVKEAGFNVDRPQDIKWQVTFEWVGRGQRSQRVTTTRDEGASASAAALDVAIQAALQLADGASFKQSNKKVAKSANALTLGKLEAIANAPTALLNKVTRSMRKLTSQVRGAMDLAKKVRAMPASLANSVLDLGRNSMAIANQFHDEMTRTPAELKSTKNKVADILRSEVYFGQVLDANDVVAKRALELEERTRPTRTTAPGKAALSSRTSSGAVRDVQGVYRTKDGDTPLRLSMRFFGDADHVDLLLQANRLPLHTSKFTSGKLLIVPAASMPTQRQGT